jgi:hypothetical protein
MRENVEIYENVIFRCQEWYHLHKPSVRPHFQPYIPDTILTAWYRRFVISGTADNMWSIWFSYYMHIEQAYCVYSNLATYNGNSDSCLAINRREPGLHQPKKGPENYCGLLRVWREDFVIFPKNITRLHWDASDGQDRPTFAGRIIKKQVKKPANRTSKS